MKWFKHESDAHTNLKLQAVIEKFGLEGYGFYWIVNELLSKENDENFCINGEYLWKIYLKKITNLNEEKITEILDFLGSINLIDKKSLNSGKLCNLKLQERSDEYTKRVRRMSEHTTDNVPPRTDKEEDKNKNRKDIYATKNDFEVFWKEYPARNGKKLLKQDALKWVLKNIKKGQLASLETAVKNYARSKTAKDGFAKDAVRWLRSQWQDWIEPEVIKKPRQKGEFFDKEAARAELAKIKEQIFKPM